MGVQFSREWRCRGCNTLLGVERGGNLHLKYKAAEFVVRGQVRTACRRCALTNEINTPPIITHV